MSSYVIYHPARQISIISNSHDYLRSIRLSKPELASRH